eukprot:TRINITY_DN2667_c0_g1_i2.p2 TRINITY_DN2667_c0_g1~~TRINITY_DN2667_c0_g1_i2.p2  ORF type:complete len:277 (-),score=91.04 TRINITY_DN2667_c0_g1_i2:323-1153(-)
MSLWSLGAQCHHVDSLSIFHPSCCGMYMLTTPCSLSCIALLYPLIWQGTLIPVLPSTLEDLLDAPVPYILGTQVLCAQRMAELEEAAVIVDCDRLQIVARVMEGDPELPRLAQLTEELAPFHDLLLASPSKFSSSSEEKMALRQLMTGLRKHTTVLVEDTLFKGITRDMDFENGEDVDTLIRAVPKGMRAFLRAMVQTQQFSVHFHKMQEMYTRSEEAAQTMLKKLDEMISAAEEEVEATREVIEVHTKRLHEQEVRLQTCYEAKEKMLAQLQHRS